MKQDCPSPYLAEGASVRLCEAVARLRYEDLPPTVVSVLKALILDELGVIGGAARAPGIPELLARLTRWERDGSATALIGKCRLSPPSAALANGAAGHALDFDDQHDPARIHTNCVTLPALLATAEERGGIAGREFLLAYAVSAELHARLGLACWNSLGKGWHPTMLFGSLAAGIGAGRLLGLDAAGLANALGLAYHQASGSAQSMRDGVLAKRIGAGFAARAAVLGAFLAADGITGTRRTLEGNAGLFALHERGEVRPERLFDGLGRDWRTLEYSFKPYPCCRCNHATIGLGIGFHADGVKPDQVEHAEIRMGNVNWLTVGEPYDAARDSVVHAQFNAAYGFSRALLDGKVDLASYTSPRITEPAVAALAARVSVLSDPAIEATAIEPARVTLRLKDGRTLERAADTIKGSPREPLTEAELAAKFGNCLAFGLGAGNAEASGLAAVVRVLETSTDVARDIVGAFPRPAGSE
ncbi:MAG: MmgE/PrpD family protein [Burkholderiales bacterium]|nr:MmgE/PrpD family protein [Burkholderiales bacterium]